MQLSDDLLGIVVSYLDALSAYMLSRVDREHARLLGDELSKRPVHLFNAYRMGHRLLFRQILKNDPGLVMIPFNEDPQNSAVVLRHSVFQWTLRDHQNFLLRDILKYACLSAMPYQMFLWMHVQSHVGDHEILTQDYLIFRSLYYMIGEVKSIAQLQQRMRLAETILQQSIMFHEPLLLRSIVQWMFKLIFQADDSQMIINFLDDIHFPVPLLFRYMSDHEACVLDPNMFCALYVRAYFSQPYQTSLWELRQDIQKIARSVHANHQFQLMIMYGYKHDKRVKKMLDFLSNEDRARINFQWYCDDLFSKEERQVYLKRCLLECSYNIKLLSSFLKICVHRLFEDMLHDVLFWRPVLYDVCRIPYASRRSLMLFICEEIEMLEVMSGLELLVDLGIHRHLAYFQDKKDRDVIHRTLLYMLEQQYRLTGEALSFSVLPRIMVYENTPIDFFETIVIAYQHGWLKNLELWDLRYQRSVLNLLLKGDRAAIQLAVASYAEKETSMHDVFVISFDRAIRKAIRLKNASLVYDLLECTYHTQLPLFVFKPDCELSLFLEVKRMLELIGDLSIEAKDIFYTRVYQSVSSLDIKMICIMKHETALLNIFSEDALLAVCIDYIQKTHKFKMIPPSFKLRTWEIALLSLPHLADKILHEVTRQDVLFQGSFYHREAYQSYVRLQQLYAGESPAPGMS